MSFLGILIAAGIAQATPAHLDKVLTLTNDRSTNTSDLNFALDAGGGVAGLNYVQVGGGKTLEKDFALTDLASADGAVLEEQSGIKALTLHGKINSAAGTAALVIRFVNNGLSGVYKDCKIDGQRGANGDWTMINAYTHQPVAAAKLITWQFGITTIEGICP